MNTSKITASTTRRGINFMRDVIVMVGSFAMNIFTIYVSAMVLNTMADPVFASGGGDPSIASAVWGYAVYVVLAFTLLLGAAFVLRLFLGARIDVPRIAYLSAYASGALFVSAISLAVAPIWIAAGAAFINVPWVYDLVVEIIAVYTAIRCAMDKHTITTEAHA